MFTFRQKILLSYIAVFLVFLSLMSPFSSYFVNRVVEKAMENRAHELIDKIRTASNNETMVRQLKELKPLIFYRVSVITADRKVLYDSHAKRLIGHKFSQEHVVDHSEVLDALKYGVGHNEDYSEVLDQKFAYTAVAFDFHGKTYVLRTAFPFRYVKELTSDFEAGFLILSSVVLILFSLMTWVIINILTKPLQNIINTVSVYEEGRFDPQRKLRDMAAAYQGEAGKLAGTLVSLSEKVERQFDSLRDERNEKEVLLESLVEGVIATDRKMRVTFANVSALRFLSTTREKVLNRSFESLEEDRAYALLLDCQKEQKPLMDTIRISRKGKEFFLDVVAAPKRDNTGAILVMLDKSDQYKILEMRKDFIANASHELKTPITIIRGFAETLHDNLDIPKEKVADITEKMVRNCDRMAALVRDLLALADIENLPSSRLRNLDLVELAEKVKSGLQELYPDAELTVSALTPGPIEVAADPELIEMAIMNLMHNGIRYSEPPAKVEVRISRLESAVKIEIKDHGIGIGPDDLPRIFERFYRVDKARSRKAGGSGLGLSIVETVIKKHHGKIEVQSELGVGTTFLITLPIRVVNLGRV